jgi:hypothetical protein
VSGVLHTKSGEETIHRFADADAAHLAGVETKTARAAEHRMREIMRKLAGTLRLDKLRHLIGETGSATAEYAIATLAAVGFAGLLVVILRSGEVRGLLTDLIRHALSFSG